MTLLMRVTLIATIATTLFAGAASGQRVSADSLASRIAQLEQRVASLESRMLALGAPKPPSDVVRGRPVPEDAKWRDLQNWRRLRSGMSMVEVRALLGEPARVIGGSVTYWRWNRAEVYFINDKLEGWSEPES